MCEVRFSGYSGMRLHMRSRHPKEFHREAVSKLVGSRNKIWTQEEKELMAEYEVSLPAGASASEINTMTRDNLLPERLLESIRGARKQPG